MAQPTLDSGMIRFDLEWPEFEDVIDGTLKKLSLQTSDDADAHWLFAIDGIVVYHCSIWKAGKEPKGWTQQQIYNNTTWRGEYVAWTGKKNRTVGVILRNTDGSEISFPQTGGVGALADKTSPRFTPDCFPPGYEEWITGALDNLDAGNAYANPVRGGGSVFQFEQSEPGDYQVVGQFFEHILMVGGGIGVVNGRAGDYVSFSCRAPASVPTANGANTGNANKVQVAPGANIIVPAAGNGAWDVDGSTLLVGEINKDLVPVPSPTGAGFWDWNPDATPSLTPNLTQTGEYDLYDFAMVLGTQANKLPLIGSPASSFASPNVRAKPLLPHWEVVVDLHKASANTTTLSVGLYAICGRRVTRP